MTRVDFYLNPTPHQHQTLTTACRLSKKAARRGQQVLIHTVDATQTQEIDQLLWTFQSDSFIPHRVIDKNSLPQHHDVILIAHDHAPECKHEIMINLTHDIPAFFSRFERVAEIVSSDETARQQARHRFKFYRDRGYTLNTHNISV